MVASIRCRSMAQSSFDLGDSLPTLPASRVQLRWLCDDDVPALLTIFGDPQVMRYWSHGPLADIDEAREYLHEIQACFRARTLFQWGVELVSTRAVIGTC